MAIRQRGQISLFDITDNYSVEYDTYAISLQGEATELGNNINVPINVTIKRGNTKLTTSDAAADRNIRISGLTMNSEVTFNTSQQPSPSPVTVAIAQGGFDITNRLLPLIVSFDDSTSLDGSIEITIEFDDVATGENDISFTTIIPFAISLKGGTGTSGYNRAQINIYKRSASTPTTPSGGTYNFTNGTLTTPSGWSTSIPATDGNPCYVSSTTLITQSSSMNVSTWSTPIKLVEDGADGADSYEITITSSMGIYFRNTAIAATLTAHVSKGGVEYADIDGGDDVDEQLRKQGLRVYWYLANDDPWLQKNSSTAQRYGVIQSISAGDVSDSISLVAKLEDIKDSNS